MISWLEKLIWQLRSIWWCLVWSGRLMNAGIKPTASPEVELGRWSKLLERNSDTLQVHLFSLSTKTIPFSQNYDLITYRKLLLFRISVTKETGLPSLHTLRDSATPPQLHWLCHSWQKCGHGSSQQSRCSWCHDSPVRWKRQPSSPQLPEKNELGGWSKLRQNCRTGPVHPLSSFPRQGSHLLFHETRRQCRLCRSCSDLTQLWRQTLRGWGQASSLQRVGPSLSVRLLPYWQDLHTNICKEEWTWRVIQTETKLQDRYSSSAFLGSKTRVTHSLSRNSHIVSALSFLLRSNTVVKTNYQGLRTGVIPLVRWAKLGQLLTYGPDVQISARISFRTDKQKSLIWMLTCCCCHFSLRAMWL